MDMEYLDPEEEFELMYGDELEMMNEMDADNFEPPPTIFPAPKSKRSLDFERPSTSKGPTPSEKPCSNDSSELSTPIDINQPSTSNELSQQSSSGSLDGFVPLDVINNKRTVSDLFGDIDDIDDIDFVEDQFSKRRKINDLVSKEEKQQKLILQIKNQRYHTNGEDKLLKDLNKLPSKTHTPETCMSRSVPSWPFVVTTCSEGKRLYLRIHSENYLADQLKISQNILKSSGLLDVPFADLKDAAYKELKQKEIKIEEDAEANKNQIDATTIVKKDLWVERYKPKIYLELLSDESTNRSLLYWLKLWDKIVFNREPVVMKTMGPQDKKDALDDHGRPSHKVALLCGPPGLGKTTLAHMIARQAGYNAVEVNASDDRSPQVFKTQLEAATQMKSVMGGDPKPNCLILDEIDGAPQAAIDVLINFVSDKSDKRGKKNKKKGANILKRPIICICNDIYVPALRSLRQIAFTLNFPPISAARMGERLMEISKCEKILTDLGTMMALSEKTNNDIRSCLSILHCLKSSNNDRVSLLQVQRASLGIKDVQQGLFSVWQTIFHIRLNKKGGAGLVTNIVNKNSGRPEEILKQRLRQVLRAVQSYGDYDRLAMGVYENFLNLRPKDCSMNQVKRSLEWFCFFDTMSTCVHTTQNYALFPYLPYPFVLWSLLLATPSWPKLHYPSASFEMNQRLMRHTHILDFALVGMPASLQAYQQKEKLLLDIIPYLLYLIIPVLRPVSVQLYSPKEKAELERVVHVMADYNLNYTQERTVEGSYVYNLDPNIEDVGYFGERPRDRIFGYTGKQMLAREIEAEKLKRASAKLNQSDLNKPMADCVNTKAIVTKPKENGEISAPLSPSVPNHLQKLTPKTLKKKVEMQAKDFFGRVVEKNLNKVKDKAKTDEIVKSDIWFHFKEGYNNAVRKTVYISDLV